MTRGENNRYSTPMNHELLSRITIRVEQCHGRPCIRGMRISVIDILDLDPAAPVGLFAYAGLKRYIAELFPGTVDVVDREALKPSPRRPLAADTV